MRRWSWAGLAALATGLLGSGCGTAHRSGAPQRAAISLPADTMMVSAPERGQHGGRFVIAETSDPKTFNVMMSNDQASNDVDRLLFTSLTEYDNREQRTIPNLAKSWEHSADGRHWTFHLRRGACFSDGHPITAADVLFSFAVVYDDSLHPSMQDALKVNGQPFRVQAPDSLTVTIDVPGSMALFETLVGLVRVLPRHVLESRWKSGTFASAYDVSTPPDSLVTSGAWRLERHVPGERTVLAPNPYWFGVDRWGHRLPYLDELVFETVPDQNTAALKFEAGDVDAVDNVKPEDYGIYARRAQAGHYTLHDVGPSLQSNFLWFNLNRHASGAGHGGAPWVGAVKHAWFADPRFRRAISKAIDRDAIMRGPLFGFGFKNWSTMTRGSRTWYSADVTGEDHDPEGAKKLLAELGMRDRNGDGVLEDAAGNRVSFTLKTNSDNATRIAMDNLIRDDLARVGIEVLPQQVEFKTLLGNIRNDFDYEAVNLGLGSAVPSDPAMAGNFYRSSGATHYWHVRQATPETAAERQIDAWFEVLADTLDDEVRHDRWRRIQDLMNQECFVVWLPSQVVRLPVRNGFGNLEPVALPHRVLWNIDRVFTRASAR
jgi:peptide/nickel transport system substrate-binding protein